MRLARRVKHYSNRYMRYLYYGAEELCMRIPVGPRVLLLNYTAGEANWGCKATSNGLLQLVKMSYTCARIRKHPIRFVKHPDECQLPPSPDEFDSYLQPRINTSSDFEWFDWADVIILNGEGSIHERPDMHVRPEPYLRLLEVYAAHRFFNKPVMAVNQTVDYWSDEFARWVQAAYQTCDYVSVREPRSFNRLGSLGVEHAALVPDAAFLTASVSDKKARRFLAVRGIADGYIGLFLGENVARASFEKISRFVSELRNLAPQVVLFAAPWVDVEVARQLQAHITSLPSIGLEAYPEMLVGILAHAALVVSGRFHCCIFAALAGTPLVPFRSNTDKIEGLMELLGYSLPVAVFEDSSSQSLLEGVELVWRKRVQLRESFKRNVPQVIQATRSGYPNLLRNV